MGVFQERELWPRREGLSEEMVLEPRPGRREGAGHRKNQVGWSGDGLLGKGKNQCKCPGVGIVWPVGGTARRFLP